MNGESLRQGLEAWLVRIWFGPACAADRLLEILLSPLLRPLSWLLAWQARRRRRLIRRSSRQSPGPAVIIVGNLVAGGTGKTPLVIALCQALSAHGFSVGLLARGYRRRQRAPQLINAATPVAEAGDEALLLARATGRPVAVGARRLAALQLLSDAHPALDVVLSDDGLQHTELPRRLELVLMHARGLGNGRCLPAGPLREPPDRLASVDAIIWPDGGLDPGPLAATSCRHFHTRVVPAAVRRLDRQQCWTPAAFAEAFRQQPLAAVAGIARPERFFQTLEQLGLRALSPCPLSDHAAIDPDWLAGLPQPWIIMTAKDAVKCSNLPASLQQRCLVLEIEARPDNALLEWLIAELDPERSS